MAEVKSTVSQLINAFKTHHKTSCANPENLSHTLLLFYAVECGLKAKYLRENHGFDTKDFESLPIAMRHGHGHDIWAWFKLLKLPNNGYNDKGSGWPIRQLHERLRYGSFSLETRSKEQIAFLKNIASNLKNNL